MDTNNNSMEFTENAFQYLRRMKTNANEYRDKSEHARGPRYISELSNNAGVNIV